MRILRLQGGPYDIGAQHGRARSAELRSLLVRDEQLRSTQPDTARDIDEVVSQADAFFGSAELDELRGIAEGAGVPLEAVIAHNLRLFRDAGGGGLHFAIIAEANQPFGLLHAANEDLQSATPLQHVLPRDIVVRHLDGAIPFVTFAVPGQVGGLNGINAAGLTVSTAVLVDLDDATAPRASRLHTILVKNILERAADIDAAIEIYKADPGCIPYSLLLTHFTEDRICQFEYDLNLIKVLPWTPDVIGTNHRLMRTNPGEPPEGSRIRHARLAELLGGDPPKPTSVSKSLAVLRDRSPRAHGENVEALASVCRPDTQISIAFHPSAGSLWVTEPPGESASPDVFQEYRLDELLPGFSKLCRESRRLSQQPDAPSPPSATGKPLIDAVAEHVPGERLVAESHLDPAGEVFLVQHQFKGRPLAPLAIMVEALAETASLLAGPQQRVVGLREIEIQNGLRFTTDDVQTVRVSAVVNGAQIECHLTCDVRNRRGDVLLKDKPHLRGIVDVGPATMSPARLSPTVALAAPDDPSCWLRNFYTENIVIYHGPIFRGLWAIAVDGEHAWGQITSRPLWKVAGRRATDGWIVNPALLDASLYACGSYLWLRFRGIIAVPDGIQKLRIGRLPRPDERCVIAMLDRGRDGNHTFYDFSVMGDNGETILDVIGYRNKITAEEPPP